MIKAKLTLLCSVILSLCIHAQTKLTLQVSMITNESSVGNAQNLLDEQNIANDPMNDNYGLPSTDWFGGWNNNDYPITAYLDLGNETAISQIFLFDMNGTGDFKIYYGSPNDWNILLTDPLTNYQEWNQHDVSVSTRYLRFVMSSPNAHVGEIVVYGNGDDVVAPEGNCQETPIAFPSPSSNSLRAIANKTMYEEGEEINFTIQSNQSGTIHYRIAPDRYAPALEEGSFSYQSGTSYSD